MDNSSPKIPLLTAWAIGGILLPIAVPLSRPVALISLGTATAMATVLAKETQVAIVEGEITRNRTRNRLEYVLAAEEYRHQASLEALSNLYFSAPPPAPAALPGAHPAQPRIAPTPAPTPPPSEEIPDFYIPLPTTPEPTPEPRETALTQILAAPYVSRIFMGPQRSGKTMLAAVAARRLQEQRNTQIFHLNLSSYGDEDKQYWGIARKSIRADLMRLPADRVPRILGEAIEMVDLFLETPNSLLIVDEWSILCSLFNPHQKLVRQLTSRLAGVISGLSSSGTKQLRALWALAPELIATNLTQEGKAMKSLQLVFVSPNPGSPVSWQGHQVAFSHELFQQLKANYAGVEMPPPMSGDRICQIAGIWYPVGVSPVDLQAKIAG